MMLWSRGSHLGIFIRSLILASLFASWQNLACEGQVKGGSAPKSGTAQKDDPANHYILLKTPVELPDVPVYTGRATFVSGTQYPDDPAAKRTGLIYLVHEEEGEVLQWYQNSLTAYQWKVNKFRPETHQVVATRGNATCTVEARPYKGPGFRTEVRLGYRVSR
jgi:hypothetical protein